MADSHRQRRGGLDELDARSGRIDEWHVEIRKSLY